MEQYKAVFLLWKNLPVCDTPESTQHKMVEIIELMKYLAIPFQKF